MAGATILDPGTALFSTLANGACRVVFDKPVLNEGSRGAFSERAEAGGVPQQLADDFELLSDEGIQRVSWSGSYWIADLPASTTQIYFRIRFFHDAGGVPELIPIYDELVTAQVTNSGVVFQTRIIYFFEADLALAFAASGGVTYWISILEEDPSTTGNPFFWRWGTTTEVTGDVVKLRNYDGGSWRTWGRNGSQSFQLQVCQNEVDIDIDIKPGSDRNSVNLSDKGRLPVAILTADDFDAADVDPSTVTLGNNDGYDTDVAARKNGSLMASLEDVDDDGDLDLILHFDTQTLVGNGDLDANTTELILNGETTGGQAIKGSDSVNIVPPNPKKASTRPRKGNR